jgi:hypothetical protein
VIDITIIGKPSKAALAFVRYTLSAQGLNIYRAGGFSLPGITASGTTSAIPAEIRNELGT